MPDTIQLRSRTGNGMRCDIRADLGGCVAGLWLGDTAVLRSVPGDSLQDVRGAASFPLLPYSNRLGDGALNWRGQRYLLNPNFDGMTHTLHGNGWQRPWVVRDQTRDSAVLVLVHGKDDDWPFSFECIQTIGFEGDSLRLTLSLTSREATPVPAGIGWHPYFVRRPGTRLAFSAQARWDTDASQLPERKVPVTGVDALCDNLACNHCFEGWNGVAKLHDNVMYTQVSSNLLRLLVSNPTGKDFVAVEPVSHVPDAFNQGEGEARARGMRVLAPNESMSAWMAITPHLHT